MKRIIALVAIFSFLLSNLSFAAETYVNKSNSDGINLAPPILSGNLEDGRDTAISLAEIDLQRVLREIDSMADIDGVTDVKILKSLLVKVKHPGTQTFTAKSDGLPVKVLTYLTHVEQACDGIFAVPVSVQRNGKRSDFFLAFSTLSRDDNGGFPAVLVTRQDLDRAKETISSPSRGSSSGIHEEALSPVFWDAGALSTRDLRKQSMNVREHSLAPIVTEYSPETGSVSKINLGPIHIAEMFSHPRRGRKLMAGVARITAGVKHRVLDAHPSEGADVKYIIWAGMGGSIEDKYAAKAAGALGENARFFGLDDVNGDTLNAIYSAIIKDERMRLGEKGNVMSDHQLLKSGLVRTVVIVQALGMTSYEPVFNAEQALLPKFKELDIDPKPHFSTITIDGSLVDRLLPREKGFMRLPHQPDDMATSSGRDDFMTNGMLLAIMLSHKTIEDGTKAAWAWVRAAKLSPEDRQKAERIAGFIVDNAAKGRDKIILGLPEEWRGRFESMGGGAFEWRDASLWIKQEFEETLGKTRKNGLKIVTNDPFYSANYRSAQDPYNDKAFLVIKVSGLTNISEHRIGQLRRDGYEVTVLDFEDAGAAGQVKDGSILARVMQVVNYIRLDVAKAWNVCAVNQPPVENYKRIVSWLDNPAKREYVEKRFFTRTPYKISKGALTLNYSAMVERKLFTQDELEAMIEEFGLDRTNPGDVAAAIYAMGIKKGAFEYGVVNYCGDLSRTHPALGMRELLLNHAAGGLWRETLISFADVGKVPGYGHSTHAMDIAWARALTTSIIAKEYGQDAVKLDMDYQRKHMIGNMLALAGYDIKGEALIEKDKAASSWAMTVEIDKNDSYAREALAAHFNRIAYILGQNSILPLSAGRRSASGTDIRDKLLKIRERFVFRIEGLNENRVREDARDAIGVANAADTARRSTAGEAVAIKFPEIIEAMRLANEWLYGSADYKEVHEYVSDSQKEQIGQLIMQIALSGCQDEETRQSALEFIRKTAKPVTDNVPAYARTQLAQAIARAFLLNRDEDADMMKRLLRRMAEKTSSKMTLQVASIGEFVKVADSNDSTLRYLLNEPTQDVPQLFAQLVIGLIVNGHINSSKFALLENKIPSGVKGPERPQENSQGSPAAVIDRNPALALADALSKYLQIATKEAGPNADTRKLLTLADRKAALIERIESLYAFCKYGETELVFSNSLSVGDIFVGDDYTAFDTEICIVTSIPNDDAVRVIAIHPFATSSSWEKRIVSTAYLHDRLQYPAKRMPLGGIASGPVGVKILKPEAGLIKRITELTEEVRALTAFETEFLNASTAPQGRTSASGKELTSGGMVRLIITSCTDRSEPNRRNARQALVSSGHAWDASEVIRVLKIIWTHSKQSLSVEIEPKKLSPYCQEALSIIQRKMKPLSRDSSGWKALDLTHNMMLNAAQRQGPSAQARGSAAGETDEITQASLRDALAALPQEYTDNGMDIAALINRLIELTGKEMRVMSNTAFIFSEKATFDNGLGVLLPKLAKSGTRIAVIATTDTQKALIDELNAGKPDTERITYAESIEEAVALVKAARYYYFKVEGDPDTDSRAITVCDITGIVKKIIEALGEACGITDDAKLREMHETVRRFAEAA